MSTEGGGTRRLTRALLLGMAVGPILQVGCAPYSSRQGAPEAASAGWTGAAGTGWEAGQAAAAGVASPEELCTRAIASRSAGDIDALLEAFPGADCVPATLAAMPPATLAAVSPVRVGAIPPAIWQQVPQQTARHLRRPPPPILQGTGSTQARSGPY